LPEAPASATLTGMRRLIVLAVLWSSGAVAAERRVALGSFDRVRINGAFDVSVATGSPGATLIGDSGAIGDIDLRAEGGTLTIRRNTAGRWGEQAQRNATVPTKIVLTTPALSMVTVIGGSRVAVTQLSGARTALSLAGAGVIDVAAVRGDRLDVQLIGEGKISVVGRVAQARLLANGAGTIEAGQLDAADVAAHLDGPGTIKARARYTAQVTSTGLGTVSIAGSPKCRVTAGAGAPVTCGAGN
jgi:hypothetical protein